MIAATPIFFAQKAHKSPMVAAVSSPVVAFDPDVYQPGVMRLNALYEMGRQSTYDYPGEFRRTACAVHADQVATIIYTSGTTGIPKGAMLTHRKNRGRGSGVSARPVSHH